MSRNKPTIKRWSRPKPPKSVPIGYYTILDQKYNNSHNYLERIFSNHFSEKIPL